MPDISLEVMIDPATAPPDREAMNYRRGEVVAGYPTSRVAEWNGTEYKANGGVGMPRTGYIHVRDVPANVAPKLRQVLTRDMYEIEGDGVTIKKLRRRLWRFVPSDIPANVMNRLLNDREITVTFTQLKNYVRKRLISAVVPDDPSADSDTALIADSDFD